MSISFSGKKFAMLAQALTVIVGMGIFSLATAPAMLADDCDPTTGTISEGALCAKGNSAANSLFGNGGIFGTIANTMIFLVGAIAVLFLIVGGLRYVVSNGDPKAVEGAKNTILYSIVGIVVAILSYAAVQFVISSLSNK